STPLPVPAKPHQGVAPSIGRLRVLLSRAQLEIWAIVTPDVTPSAFQCAFSSLNISDNPLIFKHGAGEGNRTLVISLEGFCSICCGRCMLTSDFVQHFTSWMYLQSGGRG